LFLCAPIHSYGQKDAGGGVSVRTMAFMVRDGDDIKSIAARIKVPVHEIMKANKLRSRSYVAYPGRILLIPVEVQPKIWDPSKIDLTGNTASHEDRKGSDDDEIVIDSNNYTLAEDFINLEEIRGDSIEYDNIEGHIRKVDRRINHLNYQIDSLKQVDFSFDYDDNDKNSVLGKMKMARDQYYIEGPIGKQIDSLTAEKSSLGQRRIVLRNKMTEYEYLADNAAYSERNFKRDEKKERTSSWGDHLAYETKYLQSKDREEGTKLVTTIDNTRPELMKPAAGAQPAHDSAAQARALPVSQKVDSPAAPPPINTIAATPAASEARPTPTAAKDTVQAAAVIKIAPDTIKPVAIAPATVVSTVAPPAIAPVKVAPVVVAPAPAKAVAPPVATPAVAPPPAKAVAIAAAPTGLPYHYKSDFSILPRQKNLRAIKADKPARTLAYAEAMPVIKPTLAPAVVAANTIAAPAAPAKAIANDKVKPATQDQPAATNTPTQTNAVAAAPHTQVAHDTTPSAVQTPAVNTTPATANIKTQPGNAPPPIAADDEGDATTQASHKASAKSKKHKTNTKGEIADDDADSASAAIPAVKDTQPKLPQIKYEAAKDEITAIATTNKPVNLTTKFDTVVREAKEVNADPLAAYKSDSDFVTAKVQLKEIPIAEYKNKPKYLIPADSVATIKGEFYLIRARQVLEKGDFKNGDKFLRKSLELNPNNADAWMLHADLFMTMGLADLALKEYAISSEIDSTNPKVFYNIALLYTKANNNQKAYKYFSKAIAVNDKYLLAYMGRASLLIDERDYDGAMQDYDKILAINKYYSAAYKGRGLAKMEAGKFADAVADFNQYLDIENPDGYVIYQRGIAKIYSHNLLQGCLDLSNALELGFKDAEKAIKKFCE
jgi:tetratricopeptide (TPR) repeat protein